MQSKTDDLRCQLEAKWIEIKAGEDRPDDQDWFTAYLALMYETDQRYRAFFVEVLDSGEMSEVNQFKEIIRAADRRNQMILRGWLEGRCWPSSSQWGAIPCEHAWMIVLHADNDVEFQESIFNAMKPLMDSKNVSPVHFAALSDRIALNRQGPQRYGMFYRVEEGVEVLYPVDDVEKVQERRLQLGIGKNRFRR